jgi:hypothetical protein
MAVPVRLFDDNPPSDDPKLIENLFVDREYERQDAIEMLRSCVIELGDRPHKPMTISGNARLGKSHLLWYLVGLPEISELFDVVVRVPLQPGPQDVRNAMATITMSTIAALDSYALVHGIVDANGEGSTKWVIDLTSSLEPLITGDAESLTIKTGETWARTVTGKLGAQLPGFLKSLVPLSANLEGVSTKGGSQDQTRVLRPLSIESLSELARLTHLRASPHKKIRTLIVLDDFDLMHRDASGAYDPAPLLSGITTLCEEPGLHVLTTIRQDTYQERQKALTLLCEVREFASDAPLIELFERHIQQFNDGSDTLSGAVAEIARQSSGRVGVFLRTLRDLHIYKRRAGVTTDADLYAEWKKNEWTRAANLDPARAAIVQRAVSATGGQLDAGELDQLRGSELFRFVLEDFTSRDSASVNPLWLSHLRETMA